MSDVIYEYMCEITSTSECPLREEIRAEAIGEAIHKLENSTVNCHEDYVDGIHFAIGVLESIKEQK